jgi:hypothetical protein
MPTRRRSTLMITGAVLASAWLVAPASTMEHRPLPDSEITSRSDTETSARVSRIGLRGFGTDLSAIYRQSIYDAAVKRRSFQRTLMPINDKLPKVTVVTLTAVGDDPVDPRHPFPVTKGLLKLERRPGNKGVLGEATWVSLPTESRPACRGDRDPRLRLQQILGMPPVGGRWQLVQFTVAPNQIFRPCASGSNITTRRCAFKLPTAFSSEMKRREIEEVQRFVFQQMWSSYAVDFPEPGYPFTGMGWTYDWNPSSKDHYGVSEYVVRKNAPVSDIQVYTPAQFCRGG